MPPMNSFRIKYAWGKANSCILLHNGQFPWRGFMSKYVELYSTIQICMVGIGRNIFAVQSEKGGLICCCAFAYFLHKLRHQNYKVTVAKVFFLLNSVKLF